VPVLRAVDLLGASERREGGREREGEGERGGRESEGRK
jgi:hypothetical protein